MLEFEHSELEDELHGRRTPESVIAEARKKVAQREKLIVQLERQIRLEADRANKAASSGASCAPR